MENKEFYEELLRKLKNQEIILGFSFVEDKLGIFIGLFKDERTMDTEYIENTFIPLVSINKHIGKNKEAIVFINPYDRNEFLFFEQDKYKKRQQEFIDLVKTQLLKNGK